MVGLKKGIWKVLRWIIPLLISGLAIGFLLNQVDLQKLANAYTRVRISSLVWAVLVGLLSMLSRAVCWRLLLRRKFAYRRVFDVMNAGYLLNNIFPFRLGEVGRAILLGEKNDRGVGTLEVLSSIFIERIMDVILALVFFLGSLFLFTDSTGGRETSIILLIGLMIAFILLVILALNRNQVYQWMEVRKIKRPKLFSWLQPKVDALLKGFSVITQWRFVLPAFMMLLLSWSLSMVQQYIILQDFIPELKLWWMFLLIGAGALGFAVPSAPAAIGVFEAATVGAFLILNVDYERALAFALVLHALQFVVSTILGAVCLMREGQSIQSLLRRAVYRKNEKV